MFLLGLKKISPKPLDRTLYVWREGRKPRKPVKTQTRKLNTFGTQLTDVTVLENFPIFSLYCYQVLNSVAVFVKNVYSFIKMLHLVSNCVRNSSKNFPYLHIHQCLHSLLFHEMKINTIKAN
jgi:hypothetical protein